ncbi:MAG: alkaline phosphatase family protein, partial [Sphingomonadales bacterium]
MRKALITASILSALSATTALAQEKVELSADQAMAPWHHALADMVDMPVAPSSPQLDAATTLTRIAFGSCNDQDRTQEIWAHIAAVHPQAFLFIGDNIYGDTFWDGGADLATLRAAYAKQASHPEFVDFRAKTPMLTTWDDHDFGFNDGGGTFAFRRFAEQIFETYWQSPDDVRSRDGVYFSRMYGEEGKRVQL